MKNSFWRGVVGIVLAAALLVLGVVWWNRYSISLSAMGFSPRRTQIIYTGIDANGDNYRVVVCAGSGEYDHLAILTENYFGWWMATQVSDLAEQNGLGRLAWRDVAGFQCPPGSEVEVGFCFHAVYCGDNAVGPVSPITDKLPSNVTVNIHQSGSSYLLHFISFGQNSPLNGLSVEELLRSVGAVL